MQSVGAVEYTNWFSVEGYDPSNECPGYDTKQSDGKAPVMLELLGMLSPPSLPSLPTSLWHQVVAPDRVLSMDQIEVNCVLMLNWIAWSRTDLKFKLHTYAKLNCLKWNCFCKFYEFKLGHWLKHELCFFWVETNASCCLLYNSDSTSAGVFTRSTRSST